MIFQSSVWQKTRLPIKYRIAAAFALVAVFSVGSAITAWVTVSAAQSRVEKIAKVTLPAVSLAQTLAKETVLFAAQAKSLSQVQTEMERNAQIQFLSVRLEFLQNQVNKMENLGFEKNAISLLKQQFDLLENNLRHQNMLTGKVIEVRKQLKGQLENLHQLHGDFVKTATPRIAKGYNDFLDQGNEIGQGVLETLSKLRSGSTGIDLEHLEKQIRIGFSTLINTEAAEMRSNLEMVAVTYLAVGILNEAASLDQTERILQLQSQFKGISKTVRRIRLILSASTPENRKVLTTAMPLIAFGRGSDSIFSLRILEIQLRRQVDEVTTDNVRLSNVLTAQVNHLVDSAKHKAEIASNDLSKTMIRARLIQAVSAIVAVAVTLLVGWFYVSRRLIGRLQELQVSMEEQSQGRAVSIPTGGNDEISDMAHALRRFVEQRKKAETELRNARDNAEAALDQVKQLSGLLPICANCKKIRDDKGYWNQIESYIQKYSDAEFSHGLCPECSDKFYGKEDWYIEMKKQKGSE